MTQQTLGEKIKHEIETSVYGFCCGECGGGGANGQDKCEPCNGTGIIDWNYDIATKQIIKQVMDWVDKEVIGEDEKEQINGLGKELSDNVQGIRNTLKASQRQKLQQLKEEV